MISTALIDDTAKAYKYFSECFALAGKQVSIVSEISQLATDQNFGAIERALAEFKGPLLLFVDIDLVFPPDRRRVLFAQLTSELEAISTTQAQEAKAILAGLEGAILDGLHFALVALKNANINPLSIRISTRSPGLVWRCPWILSTLIPEERRKSVQVVMANIAFSDAVTNLSVKTAFEDILAPILEDFGALMHENSGPKNPRDEFLSWIVDQHDHIHDNNRRETLNEFVRVPAAKLLGIPPEEWDKHIWPKINEIDLKNRGEIFLRCGARDRFGVVAGWLFALAAFRASGSTRDWRDVFRPADIVGGDKSGWNEYALTPALTLNTNLSGNTRHDSIRQYNRLCDLLFEIKNQGEENDKKGPCESVRLSGEGLEFLLSFDSWVPESDKKPGQCLANYVREWRDGYLRERQGSPWINSLKGGPHTASRALLDWQLVTMLSDYSYSDFGVLFNKNDHWLMRLERFADREAKVYKTKVIFGG